MKSVIIHYQEIALKGKNRPWFVARLVRNIREATRDLDIEEVRVLMGRIELVLGPERDLGTGARSPGPRVRHRQLRAGRPGAAGRGRDRRRRSSTTSVPENPATFRVSAKRADKRFPLSSPEIEREVGGRIKEARNWTRQPRQSGAHDPGRGADPRSVLFLRHRPRRRRASRRRQRHAWRACSRAASIRRSPPGA